jgi:hypothetical protein
VRRLPAVRAADGVAARGRWKQWFGTRVRVATAGHVAVAIIASAAGIARMLDMSMAAAAGAGALAAAPVVIASVRDGAVSQRVTSRLSSTLVSYHTVLHHISLTMSR